MTWYFGTCTAIAHRSRWTLGPMIVVALACPRAQAQPYVPPVVVQETPSHLVVGRQYFDASPSGMREYLVSIRSSSPQLYATLDEDVRTLESRDTTGKVLMYGVGTLGVVVMFAPLLSLGGDTADCSMYRAGSPQWDQCYMSGSATSGMTWTWIAIGAAISAVGLVGGMALTPGRGDLMRVVNKHNRLGKNVSPLRLQIGANATNRYARLGLDFRF